MSANPGVPDAPEVDLDGFAAAHEAGGYVLDVREPDEYEAAHVAGAVLMPMGEVQARAGELPRDRPVYVICHSGHRSLYAAAYLGRIGVDAHSVEGGTAAWVRSGRPYERGLPPNIHS